MRPLWLFLLLLPAVPAIAAPFIEATVEPADPYVQQQVIYRVRLYRDSHLQQGDFLRPEIPDVLVRPAGSRGPYRVTRQGREMELLEETWLLFPQRSGSLKLPAPVFSGRDFYLRGKPLELDVKPRPPGSGEFPWLVTGALELRESWDGSLEGLERGERRLREIHIRAREVTGAQLPPLALPGSPAFHLYRLPPQVSETFEEGVLWGERRERFLYVARGEGQGTLPAVAVRWWDPGLEQARVKRLPAVAYRLVAGADGSPVPVTGEAEAAMPAGEGYRPYRLLWLAAAVLAAAALSWLVGSRIARALSTARGHLKLLHACMVNRPRQALEALRFLLGGREPLGLAGSGLHAAHMEALRRLDRALFGPAGTPPWQGRREWRLLRRLPALLETGGRQESREALPPLWRSG